MKALGTAKAKYTAPTFRRQHNAISTIWVSVWMTCSITASPSCTIPPTARPMPGHCAWSGRASRFVAGRMVKTTVRPRCWPDPRHAGVSLPHSSILIPPSPASPERRYDQRSPPSPSPQPSVDTTWRATISPSPPAGGHYGVGDAVMPGQGALSNATTRRKNAWPSAMSRPPSATRPSTSTSTPAPSGATSRPQSGATSSAATKSSRSGSPTANALSSPAPSAPKKSSNSPIRPGEIAAMLLTTRNWYS